jgi:hypothetical protein
VVGEVVGLVVGAVVVPESYRATLPRLAEIFIKSSRVAIVGIDEGKLSIVKSGEKLFFAKVFVPLMASHD